MRLGGLRIQMSTTGRRTLNTVSDTGVDKLQILLYQSMLGEVKVASALSADLCHYIKQSTLINRGLPNGFFSQNQRTESTESGLINCFDVFYKLINTKCC